MKTIFANMTLEERQTYCGRVGEQNGMFGSKRFGNKNPRWNEDKLRVKDINLDEYISHIKAGHTNKELMQKFNILEQTLFELNKIVREKYNINSLRCKNHINMQEKINAKNINLAVIRDIVNN